jgi:hypothetical protein
MSEGMKRLVLLTLTSCLLLTAGCGSDDRKSTTNGTRTNTSGGAGLPRGGEPVELDPADFTTRVDNPYFPLARGSRWVYRARDERIVVTVTNRSKNVAGIDALVVRDTVTERKGGEPVEVTDDWYAQDSKGNVWYLGEDTKEYKNGKVSSTKGSFEHGVDGAYGGIIMPAKPRPGQAYRQEYYKGEAEDRAKVLRIDASAKVSFGAFDNCVETEETTPLESDVVEHKFYAPNVGPVLRTDAKGGGREELISFTRG